MTLDKHYYDLLEKKRIIELDEYERLKKARQDHDDFKREVEKEVENIEKEVSDNFIKENGLKKELKFLKGKKIKNAGQLKESRKILDATIQDLLELKSIFTRKKSERLKSNDSHLFLYSKEGKK